VGVLPQANFAILLVAITSFDLKTRRNCYSSMWISLAILYLAAVYAWDYAFGILLALWALYLAGFWIASHLKRMEAGVRVPARAELDEPRVSGDAALRPATIHATGPAAQPGHVRADVSRSPTLARCDQRRVSDPEPLRAGGRPARGRVRHVSHA